MAKTYTHEFKIRLRFDRKISHADARREAKDNIHGEFYTMSIHPEAETFKVSSIK